jgi:hypothetical protein
MPMTPAAGDDLRFLLGAGADHHFGFGHNLALTSFSVPRAELAALDRSGPDGTFADLVIHVAAHEGLDLAGTQELIDHLVAAQDEVRRLTQD